jgi:hypothetical protein
MYEPMKTERGLLARGVEPQAAARSAPLGVGLSRPGRRLAIWFRVALFTGAVMFAFSGQATAGFIAVDINALGPSSPTATVNGVAATLLSDSSGNYLHFQVQLTAAFDGTANFPASAELLDSTGSHLTDQLLATILAEQPVLDIEFAAAPAALTYPSGTFDDGSLNADGTFQNLLTENIPEPGNSSGSDTVEIFVAGGVDITTTAAPEPASLTLLGIGVASLAGYGWRRKCAT